ncbi:GDP-mannose 4,6-dehydratase [soil metagenome]
MKILVTGGAGFIGSHVVSQILEEIPSAQITVLDDFNDFYAPAIKRANVSGFGSRAEVIEADIRDGGRVDAIFAAGGFDAVVHLAARAGVRPSIQNPALYIDTNVTGTYNLLEASRAHAVPKFVFASSSSVYGLNKKVPFSEDDPIQQTISPYAATKLAGEQLCSNFAHLYGLQVVCLRFFTVYGPGQRPDLAVAKFTRAIENGDPIDKYGDGSSGRDYTFVGDIVQGVMGALRYEGAIFDIFNLGGAQTVSLNALIAAIEAATGKTARINQMPEQPGDVPFTSADVSKARRHLGFEPTTPIAAGVPKQVAWYREHVARAAEQPVGA